VVSTYPLQRRLNRQVLSILVRSIVSGKFEVDELLPREADLAEQHHVSRGVIREALRGLEERGLVTVRHGHGAIVESSARWNVLDPDVLAALIAGPRRIESLGQMLEVRRIVEIEAAALSAERRGERDLLDIKTALDGMQEASKLRPDSLEEDEFLLADVAFHRAVIDACGNPMLIKLAQPLHQSLLEARRPLVRPEAREIRAVPEHRHVYEAIAAGDPDAARIAMRAVLATVQDYLEQQRNPPAV